MTRTTINTVRQTAVPCPSTLAYHRISPRFIPAGTWVTPERLADQLDALIARNLSFIGAEECLTNRCGPSSVLVTLDDGTADAHEYRAIFALREIRPVVFVPVEFLGRENTWEWPVPGRRCRHLTAQQVRDLVAMGWEVGLHGATHRPLTGLSDLELMREVSAGKTKLEQVTGRPVRLFSYPYGLADRRVARALAAAGFARAFTLSPNDFNAEPMFLGRRPVYCIDTPADVAAKVTDPLGKTPRGRWQLWKERAAHGVGRWAVRAARPWI